MKNAIKIMKQQKQAQKVAADKKAAADKGPNWALLIVVGAFTALVTYGLLDYVILRKLPAEILGRWVIKKHDTSPDLNGSTVEFFRNGSVIMKPPGGNEVPCSARVEHDTLLFTMPNFDPTKPYKSITTPHLVLKLSETEIELEDADGSVMILERATGYEHQSSPPR